MKATPYSERRYFPLLLANGNDTLLINYSGAMVCGRTGHTHNEQHQEAICGWHKQAHKKHFYLIQPFIIIGYNIVIDGEVCEPLDFEQEFFPREATARTLVSFRRGVKVKVTTFLTDTGVLSLTIDVLKSVQGMRVEYIMLPPNHINGTRTYPIQPNVTLTEVPVGLDFSYDFDGKITGHGILRLDRKDFSTRGGNETAVIFDNISDGWSATAYTSAADAPDEPTEDYANLREQHIAAWSEYFGTSTVQIPDADLNYAADLARYLLKANMHPTGGLPAGPLPYHWGGGTCCPFDSELMQRSLMMGGNFAEAHRHLMFYINQYEAGKRLVAELGLRGVAFSNWSDVFGNHKSGDIKYELTKRKPVMIAIAGMVGGNYNLFTGENSPEALKLLLDCAEFIESGFVRDGKIVSTVAGNETDVEVERDSWMLSTAFTVFQLAADAAPDTQKWKTLAQNMRSELEKNRHPDGYLMTYQNAGYADSTAFWMNYFIPCIFNGFEDGITLLLDILKNAFGIDGGSTSEVYQDWPWNHCLVSIAFAQAKRPAEAFKYLKSWFHFAASNGAVPEKIRLDGYPIGYWYPSPYALYLNALYTAFAHFDANENLCLLYGFDGEWQNLYISGLRLPGNVTVSIEVTNGIVVKLEVLGKVKNICVNPIYKQSCKK